MKKKERRGNEVDRGLVKQYHQELSNSLLYFKLSSLVINLGYEGFYYFMKSHGYEEHEHAMKIYKYLIRNRIPITFHEIIEKDKGVGDFKKNFPLKILRISLQREKENSRTFMNLFRLSDQIEDFKSQTLLTWFINEQREEEALFKKYINMIEIGEFQLEEVDRRLLDEYKPSLKKVSCKIKQNLNKGNKQTPFGKIPSM